MSTVPDPSGTPSISNPPPRPGVHTRYRIAAYRARNHMTQAHVAGRAGITREYLSMIENGRRAADKHSLLAAIARALGIDVTALTTAQSATLVATGQSFADQATVLRLPLRGLHASVRPGPDGCPVIVLTDGVLRIALLTGPDDHPKQNRNAAVRISDAIGAYLSGRKRVPS